MSNSERLKSLCGGLWMSGLIRVESCAEKVVLRKRYYPFLCAIWCFGIMGGLGYWCLKTSPDWFGISFLLIGLGGATGFVIIAVLLDRKPPLLEYDLVSLRLSSPRSGIHLDSASKVRLGIREVVFQTGEGQIIGEALYIAKGDEDEGSPIFVEHGRGHLRAKVQRFAALTHLPVFTLSRISTL